MIKKPTRYVEQAYAVVKEIYKNYFFDEKQKNANDHEWDIEFCGNATLYQDALRKQPVEAKAAFKKEVMKAVDKKVWTPVLINELTKEQRGLIMPMMKNFVEKLKPDNTFDKFKVRVLFRGDLQHEMGEREGPVCRVESLKIIMCITAVKDLEIFTIDITAAYMNTVMPEEVKQKWMKLDKDVTEILLEINREYYQPFVQDDGTMIVRNEKLLYGYVEAAHYWNETIAKVFVENGWKKCMKDKCTFVKRVEEKFLFVD